jgi:hypothetical protein
MLAATNQSDWESYKRIRAELSNRRLMIVCQRLFGETDRAREHARFLYQQQGLLQIFEDFCLADTTNCAVVDSLKLSLNCLPMEVKLNFAFESHGYFGDRRWRVADQVRG